MLGTSRVLYYNVIDVKMNNNSQHWEPLASGVHTVVPTVCLFLSIIRMLLLCYEYGVYNIICNVLKSGNKFMIESLF